MRLSPAGMGAEVAMICTRYSTVAVAVVGLVGLGVVRSVLVADTALVVGSVLLAKAILSADMALEAGSALVVVAFVSVVLVLRLGALGVVTLLLVGVVLWSALATAVCGDVGRATADVVASSTVAAGVGTKAMWVGVVAGGGTTSIVIGATAMRVPRVLSMGVGRQRRESAKAGASTAVAVGRGVGVSGCVRATGAFFLEVVVWVLPCCSFLYATKAL